MVQNSDWAGAACGASKGIPNLINVHPGNCVGCRHLAISRENNSYWLGLRKMHLDIVSSSRSDSLCAR